MKLHNQIIAVEQATNATRAIDGDVIELLNLQPQGFTRAAGSQPELFRDNTGAARIPTWLAPKLMSSVDAALELMTPGWRLESLSDKNEARRARCILSRTTDTSRVNVVGYGCSRAAAALAAALRSKALDRGSPMPPSAEHMNNLGEVVRPDRERPTLHINV